MSEVILIHGIRHVVWQCRTCGVFATCPEVVYEEHRQEGGYHHCPNGHQWGWSKEGCEREKLRRERDRLKQQLAQKDDELATERQALNAAHGQIKRLKKRTSAGVCPCCNRTFQNLARHMAGKHPGFVAEPIAGDEVKVQ